MEFSQRVLLHMAHGVCLEEELPTGSAAKLSPAAAETVKPETP